MLPPFMPREDTENNMPYPMCIYLILFRGKPSLSFSNQAHMRALAHMRMVEALISSMIRQ